MEGETLKCFSRSVYPIIQQQHKILTTLYSLQKLCSAQSYIRKNQIFSWI